MWLYYVISKCTREKNSLTVSYANTQMNNMSCKIVWSNTFTQWILLKIRKHLRILVEKLENKGTVREQVFPHGKFVFWGQEPQKTLLTPHPNLKDAEWLRSYVKEEGTQSLLGQEGRGLFLEWCIIIYSIPKFLKVQSPSTHSDGAATASAG